MKGERKKPTAMFTARPAQLEATFLRARILRLIHFDPISANDAKHG
jgi:hypothetical protein